MSLMTDLERHRLVAIVRGTDANASVAASLTLLDAGLRVLEIAMTTPDALRVIESVAEQAPADAWIGAGTVLEPEQVVSVLDAGARFIVTPAVTRSITFASERGIPSLCGAYTATEALDAMDRGASAVKLFPAFVGGPPYLTALREPLPHIPFIPVGGVGLDQVSDYFDRGAIALGLGGPLLGDAATGGDLGALRARADAFIAAELANR